METSKSKSIGPALPPHLLKKQNADSSDDHNNKHNAESSVIGPALPPHLLNRTASLDNEAEARVQSSNKDNKQKTENAVIGPALPPHLLNKSSSEDEFSDDSVQKIESTIGPALPPHLQNKNPSDVESDNDENESLSAQLPDDTESKDDSAYGPALPPHLQKQPSLEDSDDEDVYGPLPVGVSSSSQAYQALEERALQIKLDQLDSKEEKAAAREEWMLELPNVGSSKIGLGPRQFRKNQKPDFSDRSSWTDTPEQKAKKLQGKTEVKIDLKKEAELREILKRDDEQARMAEKHNKKRKKDKSLVEMHQDKLKKKKKQEEEDGLPTRRPFNREIDLKVNQFDDAQKKSILKKAMHLDDRFSSGQSKFL